MGSPSVYQRSDPGELGSLSGGEWGFCIAAIALLIIVSVVCGLSRRARRWRAVSDIELDVLPAGFLTLSDLPRSVRGAVLFETDRESHLRVKPPWREGCGWGGSDSEYEGIHFKRSIAASVSVVEEKAMRRDPRLSLSEFWKLLQDDEQRDSNAASFQKSYNRAGASSSVNDRKERVLRSRAFSVRSYINLLPRYAHGLDTQLAAQYADFVERAHTAGVEFTEREYRTFVGVLLDVVRGLEIGDIS